MLLCANPRAQYLAHKSAIDTAVLGVFGQGMYVKGENCSAFESEFAAYVGVKHGVGVANGTDAVSIALSACGVGAGDEVITVSHTAVATVAAVEQASAIPVLVDIEPETYVMDVSQVARAITPRTKAVVAVHLYGHPVDLAPLKALCDERDLWLVEDCAQAHGARHAGRRVGSVGDIAAFSFYPTKNLGAIGDGGLVATNDEELARRARLLREYGWATRYVSDIPGRNSRLDELQAAILRVKLPHLDADNAKRRRIADLYRDALAGTGLLPVERDYASHVYHLFVLRSPKRDALIEHLKGAEIQGAIHYPVPVHLQPAYAGRIRLAAELVHTERASREIVSLPMYPELTPADATRVAECVRAFV